MARDRRFVTGASSGFGAAITRHFSAAGHRVIAAGRREERLNALANELGRDRVLPLFLDVRDQDAVAAAVNGLPADHRDIDLLVKTPAWRWAWSRPRKPTSPNGTP